MGEIRRGRTAALALVAAVAALYPLLRRPLTWGATSEEAPSRLPGDELLPEFQDPEVGDTIRLGSNRMRLERVEPRHVLAWRSEDGNWVWTFVLEDHDGRTRLISRNRFRLPTLAARISMLPMEPGSLLMERRMLRGIQARAERLASAAAQGSSREADSVRTRLP